MPSAAVLASSFAVPASRNRGSAVSQGRQLAAAQDGFSNAVPGSAASPQFSPQASPHLQPVELDLQGLQQYQPAVSNLPVNHQLAALEYEASSNSLAPLPVSQLLRHSPLNAQLLSVKPALTGIMSRLPDNATLLRPNIKDTFSCIDKVRILFHRKGENTAPFMCVCMSVYLWIILHWIYYFIAFSFNTFNIIIHSRSFQLLLHSHYLRGVPLHRIGGLHKFPFGSHFNCTFLSTPILFCFKTILKHL